MHGLHCLYIGKAWPQITQPRSSGPCPGSRLQQARGHIVRATTLAMDSSGDGGGDGILEGASPRASVDGEAIDSEDEEGALAGSSPPHSTASHFACSARAIAGKQVQRP